MAVFVFPKFWLKSKTVIINGLSLLLLVIPSLTGFLTDLAVIPELAPAAGTILGIVNVLNIILRFTTKVPVSITRDPEPIMVPSPQPTGRKPSP
jgi:hypothetical protein